MELKARKKTYLERRGEAEFDPADVNGSDSDCLEEGSEEVNELSTSTGRGCGRGKKCDVATVVAVVGGEREKTHQKTPQGAVREQVCRSRYPNVTECNVCPGP